MIAILAVDSDYGISKDGAMPWNIKEDMMFFREKTINYIVIYGANTLRDMGRPLKNRINIILTTNISPERQEYNDGATFVYYSLLESISAITDFCKKHHNIDKVFVIGGAKTLYLLNNYINEAFITHIDQNYECDITIKNFVSKFTKYNIINSIKALDKKNNITVDMKFIHYTID